MDIIKLAALGWDGKESVREFFNRVYKITFSRYNSIDKDVLIITWKENDISCLVNISCNHGDWNNFDTIIEEILCLFYTDMGEIHGPCIDYKEIEHEWT